MATQQGSPIEMVSLAPSRETSAFADQLDEAAASLWDLGAKSLLGWRPCEGGIEALMMPYNVIVGRAADFGRLLHGPRLMGARTFETARALTDAEPVCLPTPMPIGEEGELAELVERVLRRYSVTETRHRAVGLLDIVGFSRLEPMFQVAQLNSLQQSISNAHRLLQRVGVEINLARSTTGDGYYVWNRDKGLRADLATYLVMLLTVTDNALARRGTELAPTIRSCFSIGSHFSYHEVERLRPAGHRYIVGDVTILLARMMDKCLPEQILLGDFRRPLENAREVGAVTFATRAAAMIGKLPLARLRGGDLARARCYLTGRRSESGRFGISRFYIHDKHGFRHAAYNQKFNVYLRPAPGVEPLDAVYLGRRHEDLGDFTAEETTAYSGSG